MTESNDVMQALIRDIRSRAIILRWCFISGSPAAWRTRWLNHCGRCTARYSLPIDARLRRECGFPQPVARRLMRNAGIEVVEALKVNLMRVFLRRMDLRQHRKMIMIDNYIAYTGSMNMVDPPSTSNKMRV